MSVASLFGFGPGHQRLGPLSIRQWVWVFALATAAVQFYIAILSALEFRQQAGDLGIFMQAFSNTGNGRLFWTTQVYLHFGTSSLLNIHFAWPIFALYPIYVAFPSMTTLFVIQGAVIAIAAVPLSSLTSLVTGSQRKGLVAAGIYAAWAPMYVGMPNSFHLEAFLPLEFFLLVYFWWRQQFGRALLAAVFAGFTLDVAPVFTALLGLMFLTYPLESLLRGRNAPVSEHPPPPLFDTGSFVDRTLGYFRWRPVYMALALILLSGVTFFSVRYLEIAFPAALGIQGQTVSATRVVGFGLSNIGYNFGEKVLFWAIMLGSVGFLPLLYPRILVMLVPWVGYTFAEQPVEWYQLPAHYVAIAAVPIFLGVAFSLRRLNFAPTPATVTDGRPVPPSVRQRRRSRRAVVASLVVVGVILVVNVGLNPINPITSPAIQDTRSPIFTGSGGPYGLTLVPTAGFDQVRQLISVMPAHATVLVSDDLYPLASADPNAWCFNGDFTPAFVPFNNTTIPMYVLSQPSYLENFNRYIDGYASGGQTYPLDALVWNPSVYGVRGWVPVTPLGPVFLFEEGYSGPVQQFGSVVSPSITFYANATLLPGSAAAVSHAEPWMGEQPSIYSPAYANGTMWTASDLHHPLPPGLYRFSMTIATNLSATNNCSQPAFASNPTLMRLEANPPDYPNSSLIATLNCSQYLALPLAVPTGSSPGWRSWNITLNFPNPVYQILFFGKRPVRVTPLPIWFATATMSLVPVRTG